METKILDIRGYSCPYNLIATKSELNSVKIGDKLLIITDFQLSSETIPHFVAKSNSFKLLNIEKKSLPEKRNEWNILVERYK
ncbi:MAG: sulfurtransferase TusA family protein [Candidatus Methanoperedens sp.]|nr:sulfurtransferase TusA family protein [Candidatus Methanoperedens sp.]